MKRNIFPRNQLELCHQTLISCVLDEKHELLTHVENDFLGKVSDSNNIK